MTPKKLLVLITVIWIAFVATCLWIENSGDEWAKLFEGTRLEEWANDLASEDGDDKAPTENFVTQKNPVSHAEEPGKEEPATVPAVVEPPVESHVEQPKEETTLALMIYNSEGGLHAHDFASKKFRFFSSLTVSDPKQHVRALEFAVRPWDQVIFAGDGQAKGYPFYKLDLGEKHLNKVAHANDFLYSSLSFNPSNGMLYGTIWEGPQKDFLVIIEPNTGKVDKVNPIVSGAQIAFAPDGQLYAVISGGNLGYNITNGQLYQINPDTAAHQYIGMIDLDYSSSSFTIAPDGTAYVVEHTGKLHTVDLRTAKSTLVGDSGIRSAFGMFVYKVPADFFKD